MKNLTGNSWIKYNQEKHKNIDGYYKDFRNNDKKLFKSGGAYFETDHFVGFDVSTNTETNEIISGEVIFSKSSTKAIYGKLWLLHDKLAMTFPRFVHNDCLVSVIPAHWLIKNKKDLLKKYDIAPIFNNLTKMSNPILVYYKIKDF